MSDLSSQNQPENERRYTLSISDADRKHSYEIENERWALNKQIRDWIVIIIAVILWVGFQLSIFFLVPGIK